MKDLYKEGCELTNDSFYQAARNGDLENMKNMKWLQDNGCHASGSGLFLLEL